MANRCGNKHLLADNSGLLDQANQQNFTNAVEKAKERGENVVHLNGNDENLLNEFLISKGDGNSYQLVPRPGDDNIIVKDKVSATGSMDAVSQREEPISLPNSEVLMEGGGKARRDTYDSSDAFILPMPDGLETGDVVHLTTHMGLMVMPIPDGVYVGCRLQALGAIECRVPIGLGPGDIIKLQVPDGDLVTVPVPDKCEAGSFLQVAYPVAILPPEV